MSPLASPPQINGHYLSNAHPGLLSKVYSWAPSRYTAKRREFDPFVADEDGDSETK